MKRLLLIAGSLLVLGSPLWAAGQSYDLPVSSGSGYRTVDVYNNATGRDRQAIVVGDRTSSATVTVDPAGWMNVQLATSTNNIGSIANTTFTVVTTTVGVIQVGGWNLTNSTVGVTGTVSATQSGNWNLTNSTVGVVGTVAATQSGNWNLSNSTVGVVGTVAATQSGSWNLNNSTVGVVQVGGWNLTNSTVGVVGTVSATQSGNWNLNNSTVGVVGTVAATQSGTWSLSATTVAVTNVSGTNLNTTVNGSTIAIVGINGNPIPVSGSFSASSVNLSTALFNGTMIGTATVISGVGPFGNPQTFAVNSSSQVQTQILASTIAVVGVGGGPVPITGSISANLVNITTAAANTATPQAMGWVGGVNWAGTNIQPPRMDTSSNTMVYVANLSTIQVVGATVSVVGLNGGNIPAVVNASTVGVVQVGGWNLTNSTVGVVGTVSVNTHAVTINQGANNIGNVNVISTNTLNTSQQGALPQGGNSLGNVNVTSTGPVSMAVTLAGGTTASVGYVTGLSSVPVNVLNTVSVTGSLSANLVNVTTAAPNGASPQAMTWGGVINWPGTNIQSQRVNISSDTMVYVTNLSTQQIVNSTIAVQGMESDNGALATTNRTNTNPGVYFSSRSANLNGTANTVGKNAALKVGTDGLLATAQYPSIAHYAYTAATNTITLASTPNDVTALCGNANNTVLVYGLSMTCTQTTAGTVNMTVLKRSSAYSGAWSTMTATPQDSNYTVVQSSAIWFTANATTLGTEVGHLDDVKLGCDATGTASPNDIYMNPPEWRVAPIVLRGATQCVAVYLNRTTVTGGVMTARWSWIEDPSL